MVRIVKKRDVLASREEGTRFLRSRRRDILEFQIILQSVQEVI